MNKLKFNEGGQPTYLDDLKTLQDNHSTALESLLAGLTGGVSEAYLLQPYSFDTEIVDAEKA